MFLFFIPMSYLKCICLESFHSYVHKSNFQNYFQAIENLD